MITKQGGQSPSTRVSKWDSHLPVPHLPFHKAAVVVFILAVGCFWNSHDADFVFDDSEAIINNSDLLPDMPLWELFQNDFWGGKLAAKTSHKSYRPLTVLTFRLNYFIAGKLHASHFHIVNILLHGIVSVLMLKVFSIFLVGEVNVDSLYGTPKMSLLCAVLFAVHPIHTESVAGAVGRADLMCALCFLLSFILYVKTCHRGCEHSELIPDIISVSMLCTSMVLCAASTLFKEQGITVLGICSAYDLTVVAKIDFGKVFQLHKFNRDQKPKSPYREVKKDSAKPLISRHIFLVLTGLSILITRWHIMGSAPPVFQLIDNPHSFVNGSLFRFINYNYIYSLNAWILINPWWLCFDWSMGCVPVIDSLTDLRILAAVVFWVALGGLLSTCLNPNVAGHHKRVLTMSLALMIVPFLPASNLLFRVGFVIAERVLYLPVAGFCILISLGARQLSCSYPQHRKAIQGCLIGLIVLFTLRSVQRSSEWKTEKYLFESGANVCPGNAKVHYNIAKLHGDAGNMDLAIQKYRLAIRLNADYDQAMNNLANILKERGEVQEAEVLLEKAVNIRPEFAAAWMNLGIVQASLKKNGSAEYSYKMALKNRRKYPDCYYNLGNLYLDMGYYEDALKAWGNATAQKPSHVSAWNNVLILLDNLGRLSAAEQMAAEAFRHLPHEASLYYNLANSQGKAGRFIDSEQNFLMAIKLDSENAGYYSNLGVLYHRWNRLELAEKAYTKSLQLNPTATQTQLNLNMLRKKMAKSKL